MDLRFLKKVRVIISLLFIVSISILYFDLSFSIQSQFADYPLFLQFIPSLLSFVSVIAIAGIGFILVILITFFFGRVYCSTVCPLGTLQDIITFIRKKIKRINYYFTKPFNKTRYIIFVLVTVLFLMGTSIGLNLLDPFSNFGRIVSNILRPITIGINNSTAFLFETFNSYMISPLQFKGINLFSFLFSFFLLSLIIWLSYKYGRLYCNSICPVGTFLGIISKKSFFRIGIIESNCIECGECETECKSNCIDSEKKYIDFSRCVGCFNCLDACPSIGITFIKRYDFEKKNNIDSDKRSFFKKIGIFILSSGIMVRAQEKIEVYVKNKIPVLRKFPVTPPGSISNKNFNDHCTACHLCVSSCPTQVLQPSFLEYGLLGIMQPRMDYKASYCNYDCTICTEVCPSGAIKKTETSSKHLIQMGKAIFVKDNCVVYTQKTDCGACAEHCPTKAVKMVIDIEVNKKAPVVTDEICVGCGACEYACPTIPYKAIYIDGNPIHLTAKKPQEEELKDNIDHKEEFPF